jgi:hypothetical protein
MKTKYIILLVLTAFMVACTNDFENFNTDKKRPAVVTGEALFTNAQKSLVDQLTTPNVNLNVFNLFSQYWTETTYTDEANYDIVNRTVADNTFQEYYRDVLRDFDEAAKLIAEEVTNDQNTETDVKNKLMIIDLLTVYTYQNLVNIFGNIPYSEALDINNLLPKYDDASAIYADMINRTNEAVASLVVTGNDGLGSADIIYGGSVESWIKFGNSLKIKLGIALADVNPTLAEATITSGVAGAFSSNADDALFGYLGSTPNTNQIYAELILTGRHDFVGANTIIDIMNGQNDPRRSAYFTQIDTSTEVGVVKLAYIGGTYGESSPFSQFSHVSDAIQAPDFPGIVLTYDEILFYLAEAAQRGWAVGGTAEELYDKAIKASFDLWGASDVDTYLAQPAVAYDEATWKEKIGTQSWLALYTRGLEGYTQWRRLDYPIFNIPPNVATYDEIPIRFTYPVGEQTLNPDSYTQAAEAMNGDELSSPIFWDTDQPMPVK